MDLAIKIIVISFLSLVIIISLAVFLVILKKIFLEKIIKSSKIKKETINKKAQLQLNIMTRFENIRKNENRFLDCYKQLTDCYQIINFDMAKIKSKYEALTTESKIFFSIKFIKLYKEFKHMYNKIIKKFDEFDEISGNLSKEWVLFENVWALLLEAIFTLQQYNEENKKILINISPIVEEKLKLFSLELTKINDAKKDMTFANLANNLNDLQTKIKKLTYLIDASVNLEWALYNNLEKISNSNSSPVYIKIRTDLNKLKEKISTIDYEEIEKETIGFYKKIREEIVSEIYSKKIVSFINNNLIILKNNQKWIQNYYENNKELLIKSDPITNEFKKINKIYDELEKSISNISNDIFEKFVNYTYLCNQFYADAEELIISKNNIDNTFENFVSTYEDTKNIYFEIIAHEMLPNDQNVFELQNRLNLEYNQYTNIINRIVKKHSYLSMNKLSSIINDWNRNLAALVKKISENTAYKQMYEFLVEKIINSKQKKSNDSNRQMEKQLLFECKLQIDNNNYKNAYLKIRNYVKDRGKNVQ